LPDFFKFAKRFIACLNLISNYIYLPNYSRQARNDPAHGHFEFIEKRAKVELKIINCKFKQPLTFMKKIFHFLFIAFCIYLPDLSAQETKTFKDLWREGKKAFEAADYNSADASLAQAILLKPDHYDAIFMDGKALLSLKKYEQAAERFIQAVKLEPKEEETYMLLGKAYNQLGNYEKEEAAYSDLIKVKSGYLDAYLSRAKARIRLKKYADAIADTQKAIDMQSNSITAYYYEGTAYDSLKKFNEAKKDLEKCVFLITTFDPTKRIEASHQPTYVELGRVYNSLNLPDKAIAIFNESIQKIDPLDKSEPPNYLVYYYRAQSYELKSEYSNSIGDLNKAIADNGNFYEAFLMRAKLYVKTSQYQSAISDFSKAILLNSKDVSLFTERGKSEYELGKYENALNDFKTAFSLNPADPGLKGKIEDASKKVYEANRESQPPSIKLRVPAADSQEFINLSLEQEETLIEGEIRDQSLIRSISINGKNALFLADQKNPEFRVFINNSKTDKIQITATDIYDNKNVLEYKVGKILSDARLRYDLSGKIFAADGGEIPISNLLVYLLNKKGEKVGSTMTDQNGNFIFKTLPYDKNELTFMLDSSDTRLSIISKIIIADKNGKSVGTLEKTKGKIFSYKILPYEASSLALMSVDDAPLNMDFKGKLINGDDMKSPIAFYTINLVNDKGEILDSKKTDAFGYFLFSRVARAENYTMKLDPTEAGKITATRIILTDEKGRVIKEFSKNNLGQFEFRILPADESFLAHITEEDPYMRVYNLSEKKPQLDIIENIYYESGAFAVTPETEVILQKLATVLKGNPKVRLEVQSHTDSRAGDDFNLDLSNKRAVSVVEYIAKSGIEKGRIKGEGLGETRLMNHCANGVECSDAEHRQNRRTVFKLTYVE
jgi:tetratricopeptide (TPR) repeat protein/outer membrane protein OmpA-like peptidoglycan-associated protein